MRKRRADGNLKPVEKFEMRQFREAGMAIRECASYFNVSMATAMRALAEMREKFGPEKLPPKKRHLARWHVATSHNVTSHQD
jgi:transposase